MSIPCKFCGSPSTVHLANIVLKQKHETHLCESCAIKLKIIPAATKEINIQAILELTIGAHEVVKSTPEAVSCPVCGIHYSHFRSQGRLGCPNDYEAFRSLLGPLLEQVQNDANKHAGKIPNRHRRRMRAASKVELAAKLRTAVLNEDYEQAAELRDAIHAMETEDES